MLFFVVVWRGGGGSAMVWCCCSFDCGVIEVWKIDGNCDALVDCVESIGWVLEVVLLCVTWRSICRLKLLSLHKTQNKTESIERYPRYPYHSLKSTNSYVYSTLLHPGRNNTSCEPSNTSSYKGVEKSHILDGRDFVIIPINVVNDSHCLCAQMTSFE